MQKIITSLLLTQKFPVMAAIKLGKKKGLGDIANQLVGGALPSHTTTERNAATANADAIAASGVKAGTVIFNSTTGKLNFYTGAAWEAVTSA